MTPSEQSRARLAEWQARHFGTDKGAQTKAARACNVSAGTYRNWLAGRAAVPKPIERVMEYVDRLGPPPEEEEGEAVDKIEWRGRLWTKAELAEQAGMSRQALWARLARWGGDVERAVTTPVKRRGTE